MRPGRVLPLLLALHVVCTPAPASNPFDWCVRGVVTVVRLFFPPARPPESLFVTRPDSAFASRLVALAATIREEQARKLRDAWPTAANVGDRVRIGDTTYTIVHVLGTGQHGIVRAAVTEDGTRVVLKRFTDETQNYTAFYRSYRHALSQNAYWAGAAYPTIFDVDLRAATMVMGYVDGLPVDMAMSRLDADDAAAIRAFLDRHHRGDSGQNYVIDLESGFLVRIDAY